MTLKEALTLYREIQFADLPKSFKLMLMDDLTFFTKDFEQNYGKKENKKQ